MKQYRAYYKPDLDLGTPIKFESQIIDDELYFVYLNDKDIRYPFNIPFIDDNWTIHQEIGLRDNNGNMIFEGDVIKITPHPRVLWSCIWKDLGHVRKMGPFHGCLISFNHFGSEVAYSISQLYKLAYDLKIDLKIEIVGNEFENLDIFDKTN